MYFIADCSRLAPQSLLQTAIAIVDLERDCNVHLNTLPFSHRRKQSFTSPSRSPLGAGDASFAVGFRPQWTPHVRRPLLKRTCYPHTCVLTFPVDWKYNDAQTPTVPSHQVLNFFSSTRPFNALQTRPYQQRNYKDL